ncbi:MAG: endonuclease MutS2 [Clostridiales bacterium]|jgi:DNA mismatch repair protein MutS2|nr:endonuclease MutS2 [Clostridiales bacterium]
MNEKALRVLEYNKIVEKLAAKAVSTMGKDAASALKPETDLALIERGQKETSEAAAMVLRKGTLPLGGISDIRPSLKRASMGGALSIEELLRICDFAHVCTKVIQYHKNTRLSSVPDPRTGSDEGFPLLDPLFGGIYAPTQLEKEISRCIINEQELADDASPKLHDIRRAIKSANEGVRDLLNSIIHSSSYRNMLQDSVVTIRNDRYCVPVKQEYRSAFPGMQHDQSSTGATVFMEPMSVVRLNNRLKELHADEREEINAILRKLSEMTANESESLLLDASLLAQLDFAFAKGELSISMKASEPIFNSCGRINIKKGRHPLLAPETVVPTDVWLGGEFSILLITGPNTGGKTVALKTIGLFSLMGQAGLHIPAFDRSELAVFDNVFADIGDEQSIEQSLSTFSSHMSNIVSILDNLTDNSLVLLDELGAGTDPTEGAALAAAILNRLHSRSIRTAVTTHYSELKVYALSTEGVENASCEFDVETLRPTYRLLIGIPGKSNAFAISSRLGLPESIIEQARTILKSEDARFEDVITDLEISRKSVILEQERAEDFRRQAEALKKDLAAKKQKLDSEREKIILSAKEEARKVIHEAKEESDRMLKQYQKTLREASFKESEAARQALRDKASSIDEELASISNDKKALKPLPKHLKNGDRVFIHTLNQSGSVISAADQNGEVLIQAGIMKVRIHLSNLSLDEAKEAKKAEPLASRAAKIGKSKSVSPEIDLRGLTIDEGVAKADKYLDDAFLAGLAQVTIIHGKGTGALRSAIQEMLKNRGNIKSFRLGQYGEGENGVTIAQLEQPS